MEIIVKAIVISSFCVGLRITSDDGMILEFLRYPYKWLQGKDLNIIGKICEYILTPIIGCVICMASVWSLVIDYYYFNNFNKWTILLIFVVASFNGIIYSIFDKLNR